MKTEFTSTYTHSLESLHAHGMRRDLQRSSEECGWTEHSLLLKYHPLVCIRAQATMCTHI